MKRKSINVTPRQRTEAARYRSMLTRFVDRVFTIAVARALRGITGGAL